MTLIVFDIETRPNPVLREDPSFITALRDECEAPKNYKDPVKIANYIDNEFMKAVNGMALSAATGVVCAIGWCYIEGGKVSDPEALVDLEDEKDTLLKFAEVLNGHSPGYKLGGFNIRDFDIPWLIARFAVNEIGVSWFPFPRDWNRVFEIRDLVGRSGNLNKWLRTFGLPLKLGDGEESTSYTHEQMKEYVLRDAHSTALLAARLAPFSPVV